MPVSGAIGVAINGVPFFPNYNSAGHLTWTSCEVDWCNAHAGKGMDYHFHGDPFGSRCLYSSSSYTGSHPPVIGWALDGYTIYGRYTTSSQTGQSDALDSCGGHTHSKTDDYGYHYHPEVVSTTDSVMGKGSYTFTAYLGAPSSCWTGNVSAIPNFWQTNSSGVSQAHFSRGSTSLSSFSDYSQIQPCCGSTNYFAASGITLPLTSSKDADAAAGGSSAASAVVSSAHAKSFIGVAFVFRLVFVWL